MSLYRTAPEVLVTSRGDARFATDLATGRVFEINASSALLLETAREGITPEEAAACLLAKHADLDGARALQEAASALDAFTEHRLMSRSP